MKSISKITLLSLLTVISGFFFSLNLNAGESQKSNPTRSSANDLGVITFKTDKPIGSIIRLNIKSAYDVSFEGISGDFENDSWMNFKLEKQTFKVIGNINSISCYDNEITSLEVENSSRLNYLNCRDNKIKKLDLSQAPGLVTLICNKNEIETLDVHASKNLKSIECYNNNIKSLDLSNLPKVKEVRAGSDNLENINLAGCSSLETFSCTKAKLSSLDFSSSPSIQKISCYLNNIRGSEMTKLMRSLPQNNTDKTHEIQIVDLKVGGELNICTINDVEIAKSKNWKVYDFNFYSPIEYQGAKENEIKFVTTKQIGDKVQIKTVAPSVKITGLTGQWKNGEFVEYIITDQTFSFLGDITEIDCSSCGISAVNVMNPLVEKINVSNNSISSIDISTCGVLKVFDCSNNDLANLDFTYTKDIKTVSCFGNNIKEQAMRDMLLSLPNRSGEVSGEIYLVNLKSSKDNECTTEDIKVANTLNWKFFDFNEGESPKEFNGTEPKVGEGLIKMKCSSTSGKKQIYLIYEGKLELSGIKGDIKNDQWSLVDFTSNDVSIKGNVSYFYCAKCNLTSLDASQAPRLTSLSCILNEIDNINVKNLANLKSLFVTYNNIKELDLTGCTELDSLYCSNNNLSSLDVTMCKKLTSLSFDNNDIGEINLQNNALITDLNCIHNKLKVVDLSKQKELKTLHINDNEITSIDLPESQTIQMVTIYHNKISEAKMKDIANKITNWKGMMDHGIITVIDTRSKEEGNKCNRECVKIFKDKEWTVFDYADGELLDYDGVPEAAERINESEISMHIDNSTLFIDNAPNKLISMYTIDGKLINSIIVNDLGSASINLPHKNNTVYVISVGDYVKKFIH